MYKNKTIYEVIEYDEEEIKSEIEILKIQIQNANKIQEQYDFEIPNYVLEEMIVPSEKIFLFINIAVLNNRLSKENAQYLKSQFIKKGD